MIRYHYLILIITQYNLRVSVFGKFQKFSMKFYLFYNDTLKVIDYYILETIHYTGYIFLNKSVGGNNV